MATIGLRRFAGGSFSNYILCKVFQHSYASSKDPRVVLSQISSIRFQSSNTTPNGQPQKEDRQIIRVENPDGPVPEEEFVVSGFVRRELVPEVPLTNFKLEERIEKVEKKGSFSVDLFLGKFDHDFLTYPEPVYDRLQLKKLKDQALMIEQLMPQIWDDPRQLQQFNFYNLYQMSVTEMMLVFESIGKSAENCWESQLMTTDQMEALVNPVQQTKVTQAIISLIIRNCLTFWPIKRSTNEQVKQVLPKIDIEFKDAGELKNPILPIGFCWTEQISSLGSLPPQEWRTMGQIGDSDIPFIKLNGKKTRVIHEDSVENYLVYYRDKNLAELPDGIPPGSDEPNPAADPYIGCCLMHKSELKFGPIYRDSSGLNYSDVEIDAVIPMDRVVFPAMQRDPTGSNVKALGQIATCAVTLGILKNSLRRTYKCLIERKPGLLTCDIIENKLMNISTKIFAIESMLYYIAGMYDGLKDGFDAHLEAAVLKIVTYEYAYDVIRDIQLINGSEMFNTSRLQDQVNILDSFLDGNIYNRLYLSTLGIIWYARGNNVHLNNLRLAPWYPGYYFKQYFRLLVERGDFMTLNADIRGHLHPSLEEAGTNLEYTLKRVKSASQNLCMRFGKDITGAQSALYGLAQLVIDSFLLTTMCARASKSYCNGSKNSEMDVGLTVMFSREVLHKVKLYIEDLAVDPLENRDMRKKVLNELNLRNGGYFAESPLDPNV